MIVPLGIGAYRRNAAFVPEVRLVNLYLEEDKSGVSPDKTMRVQRPGLMLDHDYGAPVRGLGYRLTSGQVMVAAGDGLFAGTMRIGTIGAGGAVPMVATRFLHASLSGGTVYAYTDTLTAIVMPDSRAVLDIDQLNQYLLLLCADGRFYWAVPGETSVAALDYATAESSADQALAIRRVGDEFWIFGTETVEVWQPTGDQDAPFQPVSGRNYERGCLARDTVRRFDNSVMWVSNDLQVCRGGAVPEVVSDEGIAERLRLRTGEPSAFTFRHDGHEFYVLRVPGQGSYAFDARTRAWSEFASAGFTTWRPHVGYQIDGGMTLVGDSESGAVWRVDGQAATDAGTPFERIVTGTVGLMGASARNDSLAVGVGASADCEIRVRWRDGQEDYPAHYEVLDVRAPFDVANLYRLGMPLEPYREIEISCVADAQIRIGGCKANEAWR